LYQNAPKNISHPSCWGSLQCSPDFLAAFVGRGRGGKRGETEHKEEKGKGRGIGRRGRGSIVN